MRPSGSFSARSARISFLVFLFVLLSLLVVWKKPHHALATDLFKSQNVLADPQDARCKHFPDPGNIAIAVKTGATEAVERIPILMHTALRCAQNVMIFSDLEEDIDGYHLHDAIANIPNSVTEGNPEFDFYRQLKDAQKYGQVKEMLGDTHNPRTPTELAAWTLDKYKQLHILEDLYARHPDKDWYMMVDADTYIVWPNLLMWINQLPDPHTEKLYLGAPVQIGDSVFAHGGTGILISQAAMYELAVVNKGIAASWDRPLLHECCGDLAIGRAFEKMGIPIESAWPTMNGRKPLDLPFGPTHWCEPVVTMHHVRPNEVNDIANFELSRNTTKEPLIFAELFDRFVKDVLPYSLDDWNNDSRDEESEEDSITSCRKKCEGDERCFQFSYDGKKCALGFSIHLGFSKTSKNGKEVMRSGWVLDRIENWVSSQPQCKPEFPRENPSS